MVIVLWKRRARDEFAPRLPPALLQIPPRPAQVSTETQSLAEHHKCVRHVAGGDEKASRARDAAPPRVNRDRQAD